MTENKLSADETQLIDDYRNNTDRNKVVIQILAKGLRSSDVDALRGSLDDAVKVLQAMPA